MPGACPPFPATVFFKTFFVRLGKCPITDLNHICKSFPKRQTSGFLKLKALAEDNSKVAENSEKISIKVENTVGKGEIARYEQFLFSQCFQKTCIADT